MISPLARGDLSREKGMSAHLSYTDIDSTRVLARLHTRGVDGLLHWTILNISTQSMCVTSGSKEQIRVILLNL